MSDLQQFDKVLAVFNQKCRDNLKPGGVPFIGKQGIFKAIWVCEDDEMFPGQWAMEVPREWDKDCDIGFCWVPEEDLDIKEILNHSYTKTSR